MVKFSLSIVVKISILSSIKIAIFCILYVIYHQLSFGALSPKWKI